VTAPDYRQSCLERILWFCHKKLRLSKRDVQLLAYSPGALCLPGNNTNAVFNDIVYGYKQQRRPEACGGPGPKQSENQNFAQDYIHIMYVGGMLQKKNKALTA
jgi:hypothetical protein